MIQQIKTALIGDEQATDDGGAMASPEDAVDDGGYDTPAVCRTDPFRPEFDATDAPDREPLDMDQIFGILGNERRRYALKYLSTRDETVTIGELAERIAAWECEKPVDRITSQERKRVYVSMYQCHLPKLADASAISYEEDRGKIERGDCFEQFGYYLRDGE